MKHLIIFENHNNFHYKLPNINYSDFKFILNKYTKDNYQIIGDTLYSSTDMSNLIDGALLVYKSLYQNKVIIKNYQDLFKYMPKQLVNEYGYEGFNSEEDAEEYLKNIINTDFPYGYKNIPKKLKVYRVIYSDSIDTINKKELGQHYIPNRKLIDSSFLESIGGDNFDEEETPPYLVELLLDRNDINFEYTFSNNLRYPSEWEITTKNKYPNVDIVNISLLY